MTTLDARITQALARAGQASSDFDLNPEVQLPPGRKLRPAGVLVSIDVTGDTPQVLLTKRSSRLKHHPGQIAFPGGKQDEGDADVVDAALREAEEEVALPRPAARVLGEMPAHETVTGFLVSPVIALVEQPFEIRAEPGEVDEVFHVPLSHVLSEANFSVQSRRWRGAQRHYYTVPFGPYYIWGATARILRAFAARMNP
ncbi:MAG: CoA pyrophosphatase [Pseudomonadota bacterium]